MCSWSVGRSLEEVVGTLRDPAATQLSQTPEAQCSRESNGWLCRFQSVEHGRVIVHVLLQVLLHVCESFTDVLNAVKPTITCMIGISIFSPHLCYLLDASHISGFPVCTVCLAFTSLGTLHFVLQLLLFILMILLF